MPTVIRHPVAAPLKSAAAAFLSVLLAGCTTGAHRPHQANGDAAAAADTAAVVDSLGPEEAAAVVRSYYAAIDRRRYEEAYRYWGDGGRAGGQSLAAFRAGFSETASVNVAVGTPGRVEGAAGSRYIEVPVTVTARTTGGERQRFAGTYTLRRTVVDGASAEQQRWHLDSADLTQTE